MSSKKTWERRVLAPLIHELETRGVFVIEGMALAADTADGIDVPIFAHEELSELETQRALDAVDTVLGRLRRMYGQVPGRGEEAETVEPEEDMAPADSDADDGGPGDPAEQEPMEPEGD